MSAIPRKCRSCGNQFFAYDDSLTREQIQCPACHEHNSDVYHVSDYCCPRCGRLEAGQYYMRQVHNQPVGFKVTHWAHNPSRPLFGSPSMSRPAGWAAICRKCGEKAYHSAIYHGEETTEPEKREAPTEAQKNQVPRQPTYLVICSRCKGHTLAYFESMKRDSVIYCSQCRSCMCPIGECGTIIDLRITPLESVPYSQPRTGRL
jgi:hypothetical protein